MLKNPGGAKVKYLCPVLFLIVEDRVVPGVHDAVPQYRTYSFFDFLSRAKNTA
jgi:hypothetical protein